MIFCEKHLSRLAPGFTRRAALAALLVVSFCDSGALQEGVPRVPKKEYSADAPGEWKSYAADHPPRVEVGHEGGGYSVGVFVFLEDTGDMHYMETLGIMDSQGKVIASQNFSRGQGRSFNARFSLEKLEKDYKAFAKCSMHDLWVTPVEEARPVDGRRIF